MEYVLDFADQHLLDSVYTSFLPATSFLASSSSQLSNSSSSLTSFASTLYQRIPHPSIDLNTISSLTSAWPRDYLLRQAISLYFLTLVGIVFLYFSMATTSYFFLFNHDMMKHPRFLDGQVAMEIKKSMTGFPGMVLLTIPWFLSEVNGGGRFYSEVEEYGWIYLLLSIPAFLIFTDTTIYWIHRLEHHPRIYKHIHKSHHKWIIPTPFASFAFNPLDGYVQSIPYHLFPVLFPLHKKLYLGLFVVINCWTIFIHDSDMVTGSRFEKIINGPTHHTLHHLYFTVNYGQYFTFSDRLGNSYRQPDPELDPIHAVNKLKAAQQEAKDR
ncbi:hypothetical protein BDY24DRAFT_337081 [Mrakia frigida]|uniref:sterol desaturase family protein n=1 Tax=Mrakia frigida TaxID=29902 RepID=UPI003FCC1A75